MESIDGYSEVYGEASEDREDFQASNIGVVFHFSTSHFLMKVPVCLPKEKRKRMRPKLFLNSTQKLFCFFKYQLSVFVLCLELLPISTTKESS